LLEILGSLRISGGDDTQVSVRKGIWIKGFEPCDQRKNITDNKKHIFNSTASP